MERFSALSKSQNQVALALGMPGIYSGSHHALLLGSEKKLRRLRFYFESLESILAGFRAPPWALVSDLIFRKLVLCSHVSKDEEASLASALAQVHKEYNFCPLFSKVLGCSHLSNINEICGEFAHGFVAGLASFLYQISAANVVQPSKSRELALDGLQLYAPVAEVLGFRALQEEIEDICFGILNPIAKSSVLGILANIERAYVKLVGGVIAKLSTKLSFSGISHNISWRKKTPYSIWFKMLSRQKAFEKIASDVIAFRIIVDKVENCYRALEVVSSEYRAVPGELQDFIDSPKSNGYRSIHVVVAEPGGHHIEVQIRTKEMHLFAEHGMASHWLYKRGIYCSLNSKALVCGGYSNRIFK